MNGERAMAKHQYLRLNLRLKNFNIAVPTAFYQDESLNIAGTLAHIKRLEAQGCDSLLLCGSTGEQHSLSLPEKILLLESLSALYEKHNDNSSLQLLFGIASIRQKEAVELAQKVADSKMVAGILLAFPPYIRLSQEEAYRYAIAIIEAAGKPTILYNNPLRTGFDLSAENIIALSQHPLVEGIKDPGDQAKMAILKDHINTPFHYLAGGEINLLSKFSWGYNGLSSVFGNLYPQEIKIIFDGLVAEYSDIESDYQQFLTLIEPYMSETILVAIKKALNQQGADIGICRSPLGN